MGTAKEYQFQIVTPGKRWKIAHNTPGQKCVQAVYIVSVNERMGKLDCNCPASRYNPNKPCKHVKFTAEVINQPAMTWFGEDALPF